MNESCAVPLFVNLLEVDYKLVRVMFGIREDFGPEQSDNMVRDYLPRFILKVGIVYAEVRVKPIDFIGNELARNESLTCTSVSVSKKKNRWPTLAATSI